MAEKARSLTVKWHVASHTPALDIISILDWTSLAGCWAWWASSSSPQPPRPRRPPRAQPRSEHLPRKPAGGLHPPPQPPPCRRSSGSKGASCPRRPSCQITYRWVRELGPDWAVSLGGQVPGGAGAEDWMVGAAPDSCLRLSFYFVWGYHSSLQVLSAFPCILFPTLPCRSGPMI